MFPKCSCGNQVYSMFPKCSCGNQVYSMFPKCSCGNQVYSMFPKCSCGNQVYSMFPKCSCGNQVYSMFPNGTLRWISKAIGNGTLNSVNSPSVHPAGHIYFIHNDDTRVVALSAKDGSLYKVYSLTEQLGFLEPPILLGNEMMYLLGFKGSTIAIYTVKL